MTKNEDKREKTGDMDDADDAMMKDLTPTEREAVEDSKHPGKIARAAKAEKSEHMKKKMRKKSKMKAKHAGLESM